MASTDRWLYGPFTDLALGCGGLYLAAFAAFAVAGPELRAGWPAALTPMLLILIGMPHYGGTLVRVYEQRNDRRAYALFSVWATAAVIALFAVSVHNAWVGALFFTVYLTWSPWHYTGQNYGVALMFLRRRGVEITPGTKRLVYTSFLTSYLLAFVVLHSSRADIHASPLDYLGASIGFVQLGIPQSVANVLVPLGLLVVLSSSLLWAARLLRQVRLRDLVPTLVLVATQTLWFTVPMAVRQYGGGTGLEPLDGYLIIRNYYFMIALGHSIQYLWVTSYYAKTSAGASGEHAGQLRYAGKVLASGIAVWTLPFVLFSPDALGSVPLGAGLASLVAAAVNIHHFILDGAIWKLRHSRIASVLIRRDTGGALTPAAISPTSSGYLRRGVWAVATASVAIAIVSYLDEYFLLERALSRGDAPGASRVLDRERWFGKDSREQRERVGRLAVQAKDWGLAHRQFARSHALSDSPRARIEQARAMEKLGETGRADAIYRDAVSDPDAITRMAQDLLQSGDLELARSLLTRAVEAHPEDAEFSVWLGGVLYALGDSERSVAELRRAVGFAPNDRSVVNNLAWVLATSADPELRDPAEAVRLAEGALARSEGPDLGLRDTLAAAYAASGRYEDAIRTAREALAQPSRDPRRRAALKERLRLYESGRSYVEAPPSS